MKYKSGAALSPDADTSSIRQEAQSKASQSTPSEARLESVQRATNPLLDAAQSLLRALADMPGNLEPDAVFALHHILEHEIRMFHKVCEQANIRQDHMLGASYCLCTAIDEAAMQT